MRHLKTSPHYFLIIAFLILGCARNTGEIIAGGGSEIPNTLETSLSLSANIKPENTSMVLQKVAAIESESNWSPSQNISFNEKGKSRTNLDKTAPPISFK